MRPKPENPQPDSPQIREAEALLEEFRRLTRQAAACLKRTGTPRERLALADDLTGLIDRLEAARRGFADDIRRGRAANNAATAYGRAGGYGRTGARSARR